MKTATLITMRDRVRFLGDFPNSRRITDAVITAELNNAIEDTWNILTRARPDYYTKEQAPSTVAGVATVALAPDFYKLRKVEINVGADRPLKMSAINLNETHRISSSGLPRWYRLQGSNLTLYPTPAAVYAMRVFYLPIFADLVNDADTFDGINGFEEHAIIGAVYKIKIREQMPAEEWFRELQRLEKDARSNSSDLDEGQPFYLSGGERTPLTSEWGD
jgi:hypothetical protein